MLRKILEVFTRKYREETEYREFLEKSLPKMCLRTGNYNAEEGIIKLSNRGFQSNFKIDIDTIVQ